MNKQALGLFLCFKLVNATAYRWTYPTELNNLIHNWLSAAYLPAREQYGEKGEQAIKAIKVFINRGCHIVFSRDIQIRSLQMTILRDMMQVYQVNYDERSNVWKVTKIEKQES